MSHIRGTKLNWVGRTNARSSRNVERSLFAAKYTVPPAPRVPYSMPRPIMWLIGMKLKRDRRVDALVTPGSPDRPAPRIGDQPLGVHRALWRACAPRGVDEQRQWVVVVGDERLHGGTVRLRARLTSARVSTTTRATCVGQSRLGGFERVAVVVDLRQVVEHDQASRREAGEDQFDCVAEIVDARRR